MTQAAAQKNGIAPSAALLERVALDGDLGALTAQQRLDYYGAVCESLGLNPLTKPFDFLKLNGKLQMYARKDCTDQLRSLHKVSITITGREKIGDVYAVTARATLPDGRTDEAVGAVPIASTKGDELANALMKAETKAKRRVTLSIVGLGMLDESETYTIKGASRVDVDMTTGEVIEAPTHSAALSQSNEPALPLSPLITVKQVGRMRAIGRSNGWNEPEQNRLFSKFGFNRAEEVTREAYDRICDAMESPTILTEVRAELDEERDLGLVSATREPTADEVRRSFETNPLGVDDEPTMEEVKAPASHGFDWRSVRLTFGKHKGKTLGEVPDEYIEWLEKNWEPKTRNDGSLWPDAEELQRAIGAWGDEYEGSMQPFRNEWGDDQHFMHGNPG